MISVQLSFLLASRAYLMPSQMVRLNADLGVTPLSLGRYLDGFTVTTT